MKIEQEQQQVKKEQDQTKRKRLGLLVGGLSARDSAAIARRAEKSGVADNVWVFETLGRDAVTSLAAIAMATDRVFLGTGLVSIFARNPSTTAMTWATLDELSNGRMILGLGVSYEAALRSRHGISAPQDPFQNLKENIDIISGIISKQSMAYRGQIFQLEGFKLEFKPQRAKIPIFVGAHNPKMLEFAGEFADGVVLNLTTKEELPSFLKHVETGARRAGRHPSEIEVASLFNLSMSPDANVRKEELKRRLFWFLHMKHVRRRLKRTRFSGLAQEAEELIKDGKGQKVADVISDDFVSSLCISVPPSGITAKIDEFRKLGVGIPLLFPTPLEGNSMASYTELLKVLEKGTSKHKKGLP